MHEFGAGTHVGNLRDNNEDSYVCDPAKDLWIVADGMGGLGFGEVASAISTYTVATQVRDGHGINQAIELAHKRIKEYADAEAMGTNMGTTIVLLLSQGSLYNVFWVGDSRAYLYENNSISQLTTDHSLIQSLIDQGEITREEAEFDPRKNAVTRALGVQELETVRADSISEKWKSGQKILLCSDGLTDCVSNDNIAAILAQDAPDQQLVDELIQAALAGGGKDNITVIVISASKTAGRNEHDTHVPEDITDSTHVPLTSSNREAYTASGDETQRNPRSNAMATAPISRPDSTDPDQNRRDKNPWFEWKQWIGASFIVLAILLFSRLTTADKMQPAPFSTAELIQLDDSDNNALTRQDIPDIDIPEPARHIQLGLFSRLEGAELAQQNLSKQGFVPYIEKRLADDTTHFAVLLGPYRDQARMDAMLSHLDAEGITYFERSDAR